MSLDNGWAEWSHHVLLELEGLNKRVEKIDSRLAEINVQLQVLKTEFKIKSGFWGMLGGIIPVAVLILLKMLKLE